MFNIGFSELMLVFVIGLVVLGPERFPIAVRTVAGWVRAARSIALTVQNELTQELKLQELKDDIDKVKEKNKNKLSQDLSAPVKELLETTHIMKKEFNGINSFLLNMDNPYTIHNPIITDQKASHNNATTLKSDTPSQITLSDSISDPADKVITFAAKKLAKEKTV